MLAAEKSFHGAMNTSVASTRVEDSTLRRNEHEKKNKQSQRKSDRRSKRRNENAGSLEHEFRARSFQIFA